MKSRKYNDCITHINNRLKQETLPIQYLTAGAATLPSMHNVFSQTLHNHYAYFLNYYAKNVTQSLRRHYANIITQDIFLRIHYAIHLRKNYAKITNQLRKSFTQNTQILRKYVRPSGPQGRGRRRGARDSHPAAEDHEPESGPGPRSHESVAARRTMHY